MQVKHEKIRDDHQAKIRFSSYTTQDELIPVHWHNHLEIIYIVKGHMTAYVGENSYELTSGDILIINPQLVHYTHIQEPCQYHLIQIPAVHMERLGAEWRRLHFTEYVPYAAKQDSLNQRISAIFIEMYQLDADQQNGYQLLILQKLYQLLYFIYTEASVLIGKKTKNRTERDSQRIEKSMEFVRRNYYRPITLAEVAKLLSLSPEYFCRLFREHTGQTFFEHISQVRIAHIYQDLLQTDESITYLLDKNGITNYKTFLKDFKKTYGTTPHKLRMQRKEKEHEKEKALH